MLAAEAFGISVTEWALIAGAVFFVLDFLGMSKSGRTVRRQNADLRERNVTLEAESKAHEVAVQARDERIHVLELKVEALERELGDVKQRDQAAVLVAIESHERNAGTRHERMVSVLTEIRDAVKAA